LRGGRAQLSVPIFIFCGPHTEGVKCQLHLTITCHFHNLPPHFHLDFQVEKLPPTPPPGSTFSRLEMDILNCGCNIMCHVTQYYIYYPLRPVRKIHGFYTCFLRFSPFLAIKFPVYLYLFPFPEAPARYDMIYELNVNGQIITANNG
jgi:hypothetical protein